MQLTKHAHACVSLNNGDRDLVIDPGTWTPNAAELLAHVNTVLISHEHFDHFDEERLPLPSPSAHSGGSTGRRRS